MRIVTWNCNGAFRFKFKHIEELKADVYVIQECEDPTQSNADYLHWAGQHVWSGTSKNKGIGVFVKCNFTVSCLDWPNDGLEQFLPVRINDSFDLLAVWTKRAEGTKLSYIGQFWKYFEAHNSRLTKSSVICGDFNSNTIWDRRGRYWNHSECIQELSKHGFTSLYHWALDEQQGLESRPTFYLHRNLEKPYHIDYVFVHQDCIQSAWSGYQIGDSKNWLQHSDHLPIIVDL
jgi:exonuclease III